MRSQAKLGLMFACMLVLSHVQLVLTKTHHSHKQTDVEVIDHQHGEK